MKRTKSSKENESKTTSSGEAKFPYTTKPGSLRKLLTEIPKRPKPSKVDGSWLKGLGFTDNNDYTMIRVLKSLGFLNSNNEPTELYVQFMDLNDGPTALAAPLKLVYAPLFNAAHAPHKEPSDKLKNLFHIHSGGGEGTLQFQIQTFKALADSADFDTAVKTGVNNIRNSQTASGVAGNGAVSGGGSSAIQINVHIHLPENKSKSDYQSIIEDIGRYIFRHNPVGQPADNE